ncbi:bifunctional nuclease family protein [Moorella naiadis]|uniref:bifunctional nuclease family protein n=1 Tax=Moorella naiadis (nom. illeg.) TaxID=3093670 RepID=UPI003D9CBA8E
MLIPVKVKQLVLDQTLNPVVLLGDAEGTQVLPIWVGPFEAQAIALAMQGILTPRPLTHDLLRSLCENLGAEVNKVLVQDIRDGTYYAELYLRQGDREVVVDARPSDAIALALRTNAPLYITEKVAAYTLSIEDLVSEDRAEELQQMLANIKPEEDKKHLH